MKLNAHEKITTPNRIRSGDHSVNNGWSRIDLGEGEAVKKLR